MLPANIASSGTTTSWPAGLGVRPLGGGPSLDAILEAEIRNSSRPGSQAPRARPALTFGLTGKQKVKSVGAGRFLIRPVRTLAKIVNNFTFGVLRGRQALRQRYFRQRISASTIWSRMKSANSMPCAFSAFG